MKRRISILCHTASGNALGRAWVFVELLREHFDVDLVVAARQGDAVWAPLRQETEAKARWFVRTLPGFWLEAPRIAEELVTGDLIIAIKPRIHSFGLALAAKRLRPRPVLLDIDDWELGFFSAWQDALAAPFSWISVASNLHTRWYFRRTKLADAITVSSTHLQRRFGGTWVPHARQAPAHDALRWPLSVKPLVLFVGTPRPHKGLEDLVLAFRRVRHQEAQLWIVGAGNDHKLRQLASSDPRVSLRPAVPLAQLQELISSAWLVAIPQRDAAVSRAQLPAKLMDAMAQGKAIVATNVGDIPKWLAGDCGVVVPPSDPEALGEALGSLIEQPDRLNKLGQNARRRFLELGSYEVVRPRLVALVQALLEGREPPCPTIPFD